MIRAALIVVAALLAAAYAWVNLAPSDVARWHVDPAAHPATGRPNEARMVVTTSLSSANALATLTVAAAAEPRTSILAGDPGQGFVTYVQRSRLIGFPDYVSVRAEPEGEGARVTLWSRSRFGHSDLGVNRARLERWSAALPEG